MIAPKSSLFTLPDQGLQRCLEMYDCVTDQSRSTFQQPQRLLEPPLFYITNQALCSKVLSFLTDLYSSVLSFGKRCDFCFKVYSAQPKTWDDLNFIFFASPFLKFFLKKHAWMMICLLECFPLWWTKCCISRNVSLRSQPMQPLPSLQSGPEAEPSVFAKISLPRAV